MGPRQCALLREGCLVALLETAAVRDSSENSRNELRIVDIAEAEEDLILSAQVEVEPRVERVAAVRSALANWHSLRTAKNRLGLDTSSRARLHLRLNDQPGAD